MQTALQYDVPLTRLSGETTSLRSYQGRVLLIVNTASACGFTPQLADLQTLHLRYEDQGLSILGFPCNQFGAQEPGDEEQIGQFCTKNYGVSFPMFEKVEVNGPRAHPLFTQLKTAAPGLLGSRALKWNFTKFLVSRTGMVVDRFAPRTAPASMESIIVQQLALPTP